MNESKDFSSSKINSSTSLSSNIEVEHHRTFESLKQEENGIEFWTARKLAKILDYYEYRNFLPVIEKAKEACINSGHEVTIISWISTK